MKKFTSLLVALFIVTGILAQAPAQFKYQAVLRDADGQIMANEDVTLDISILRSDVSGSSVFDEQHIVTTTELGVINLDIGSVSDLSTVDWGADSYFIEISVNGTVMGTSQILSVPYALYAEKTGLWQKNGDTVYYNNGKVGIGTASPDVNLHIFDNERPWLKIETGGANMWALSELATPENVFQFSLLGNDVTGG